MTDFAQTADNAHRLTYTLRGQPHTVSCDAQEDGTFTFTG